MVKQRGAVHFIVLIMFVSLLAAVFALINLWHESNQLQSKVNELSHRIEILDSRVATAELKVKNVELKVGL